MLVTRLAKWTLGSFFGSVSGAVVLDSNEIINLTNYSAIRAFRTGITTVKIIVDYKWSLRKLEYESDEYIQAKSQV